MGVTHSGLRNTKFDELVSAIEFFSPGIVVKLVNGQTDEDVIVKSPYNLFVGGAAAFVVEFEESGSWPMGFSSVLPRNWLPHPSFFSTGGYSCR